MQELTPEQKAELEQQMKLSGVQPIYNEADKAPVVKYIKAYIKHNGYINTSYATREAVKGKKFSNNEHRNAFYEYVSAMLVNTGKYTRELNKNEDKGYNILLNPAHFNSRNVRLIAGIAAFISFLTFTKSIIFDESNKHSPQQLDIQYQYPEKDKEILHNALQRIDQLDRRIRELDSSSRHK